MTAKDEQHAVLAGPPRSVKYQCLSRVGIIAATGHLYKVAEHTDGESPDGNAWGERLRCIYIPQDVLLVHPRCTRWTLSVMPFLQQTNAVLGYSSGGIPMERSAVAQGSRYTRCHNRLMAALPYAATLNLHIETFLDWRTSRDSWRTWKFSFCQGKKISGMQYFRLIRGQV